MSNWLHYFVLVVIAVSMAMGFYMAVRPERVDVVKMCMEASEKEIMDYDKCILEVTR